MSRPYFFCCWALLILLDCGRGASQSGEGDEILYLSHYLTAQAEQDIVLGKERGPAGMVMSILLDGTPSGSVFGASDRTGMRAELLARPEVLPVFLLYLDGSIFQRLQNGEFTPAVDSLAATIAALDRRVLLSIGLEVNSATYDLDPVAYREAARYLTDRLRTQVSADRLELVYYVTAFTPYSGGRSLEDWYPGDDYVDWVGTSVYKFLPTQFAPGGLFDGVDYGAVFTLAAARDKPVIVLESSSRYVERYAGGGGDTLWQAYYVPYFDLLRDHPRIRAAAHLQERLTDTILLRRYSEAIERGFHFGQSPPN